MGIRMLGKGEDRRKEIKGGGGVGEEKNKRICQLVTIGYIGWKAPRSFFIAIIFFSPTLRNRWINKDYLLDR